MDSQTRLGLELIGAALALGVLGDLLLRVGPWGLNGMLWTVALAAGVFALLHRWQPTTLRVEKWTIVAASALAVLFLVRDAGMLKFATVIGLAAALALAAQRIQSAFVRVDADDPADPPGILEVAVKAVLRLPRFVNREIDWRGLSNAGRSGRAAAVGRGVVIALPVLAIFGGLLVAADASFEALATRILNVDVTELPGHAILTLVIACVVSAFLHGVLQRLEPPSDAGETPSRERRFALGLVEVGVVLGLVNLLFVAFLLIQVSYLFGGYGTVLGTPDLTVAEYARRGFFELVVVVALALPFLLGLRRLLSVQALSEMRRFRALAGFHVVLLALLLGSAAQRMVIYLRMFGLTEDRFYASAFLIWLVFVLGWFAFTVLRDHADRFAPGAVVAGLVTIISLHAINPDSVIVRTNVARAAEGGEVDVNYLTVLSADAVPALLDAMSALPTPEQQTAARKLLDRWGSGAERSDWRMWNRSDATARRAVADRTPELQQIATRAES